MNTELTHHLGRRPYERCQGEINHRNGSYSRHYTLGSRPALPGTRGQKRTGQGSQETQKGRGR